MKLSILKLHYFLWWGSLGGILPYKAVYGKNHAHASATQIGQLEMILPFITVLAKPFFCSLADHRQWHRRLLILFIILTLFGFGFLVIIPFVSTESHTLEWLIFCFLLFVANTSLGIVISLTDSLVIKNVVKKGRNYGETRVWGTVGWGICSLIASLLNRWLDDRLPYLVPGLILFIVIVVVDLLCLIYMLSSRRVKDLYSHQISKKEPPSELQDDAESDIKRITQVEMKDINLEEEGFLENEESIINAPDPSERNPASGRSYMSLVHKLWKIFVRHPSIIQYLSLMTTIGILTAFHWTFFFWYIEQIHGRDPLLMGVSLMIACLIGEVPFFMFAHRIVQFFGPSISLSLVLGAFSARFLLYGYFIPNVNIWFLCLTEILQGPTFALFYCVLTAVGQTFAETIKQDKEMERDDEEKVLIHATMQGIVSASYEGLGLGFGALIGGYLMKYLQVGMIWKISGSFALIVCVFNALIELIKKHLSKP